MRKIVLSILAFVLSFSYAKDFDKSGFLLGLSAGFNGVENNIKERAVFLPTMQHSESNFVPVGLRLGYQSFNDSGMLGTRFYVDYSYASADSKDASIETSQSLLGLNLDILLDVNIPNTESFVGVFAGLNYGFYNFDSKSLLFENSFNGRGFGYNAGIALTLASKHRIEIFYKALPFKEYNGAFTDVLSTYDTNYKMNSITGIAYQYNF